MKTNYFLAVCICFIIAMILIWGYNLTKLGAIFILIEYIFLGLFVYDTRD